MEIQILSILGMSIVTVVALLTQIFKKYVPERFVALVPLAIGIVVMLLASWSFGWQYILGGLVVGLLSNGSYQIVKRVVLNKQPKQ